MHGDLESTSVVDLRKAGVYRYAEDARTHVLCGSFKVGGCYYNWRAGQAPVPEVVEAIGRGEEFWAWNAAFERAMWREHMVKRWGWPDVPLKQWRCSMVKAATFGLPLGLEACGQALGFPPGQMKSKAGHDLMMRMARPRAVEDDGTVRWWHEEEPLRLLDLMMYCQQDVMAESSICDVLGDMPAGWNWWGEWRLDQKVNDRGVPLDLDLIQRMQVVASNELNALDAEMKQITGGAVERCSQRERLKQWLDGRDLLVPPPDLRAETLDQWMNAFVHLKGTVSYRAVELRSEAAKTSVAKLVAMQGCVCEDGRVRGGLQYYGANRTGRWAGRLVQWHNMPRPVIKAHEIKQAIGLILDRTLTVRQVLEGLDAFMGAAVMAVLSSLLRSCLSSVGTNEWFGVLDFSQIEARVLAWLAGQRDILEVFEKGEDVYTYAAAQQGSSDRQFGKVLTLALGFGMGWKKLIETAKTYGVELTPIDAKDAVLRWRRANDAIVKFWKACEAAVKAVVSGRVPLGNSAQVGAVSFSMARRTWPDGAPRMELRVRLPSGRQLVYQSPELRMGALGHNEIVYLGVDQYTKKWGVLKTYGGKIVENIVQAVARDAMSWAMTALEKGGWPVLLTVHDELIFRLQSVTSDAFRSSCLDDARQTILRGLAPWMQGCPVDVEGYFDQRFKKG